MGCYGTHTTCNGRHTKQSMILAENNDQSDLAGSEIAHLYSTGGSRELMFQLQFAIACFGFKFDLKSPVFSIPPNLE